MKVEQQQLRTESEIKMGVKRVAAADIKTCGNIHNIISS